MQGRHNPRNEDRNRWELAGHINRLIEVDVSLLSTFAQLYDVPGTSALQARLPAVHSRELVSVLEKFAHAPQQLGDLGADIFCTQHWNESIGQSEGTIRRRGTSEQGFVSDPAEFVLSGPHFYVGNPFNKTPRKVCDSNKAYDQLDLEVLPDNYLPRSNYLPACAANEYARRAPRVSWVDEGEQEAKAVTMYYRFTTRRMLALSGERTLIGSLTPPGFAHIHTAQSLALCSVDVLLTSTAFFSSLIADFLLKQQGGPTCTVSWRNCLSSTVIPSSLLVH